jgi:hypothetical protein
VARRGSDEKINLVTRTDSPIPHVDNISPILERKKKPKVSRKKHFTASSMYFEFAF